MNNKIKLRLKQILSAIAIIGDSMILRESFSMFAFEIEYFAEYGDLSFLLRYGLVFIANLTTIFLLLDYFMKLTREIRLANDLEVENRMHQQYKEKKILERNEELEPEELQEMLQNDYANQNKTSPM